MEGTGGFGETTGGPGDGATGGSPAEGTGGPESGGSGGSESAQNSGGQTVMDESDVGVEIQLASLFRASNSGSAAVLTVRSISQSTSSVCSTITSGACNVTTCTGQNEPDPNAVYPQLGEVTMTVDQDGTIFTSLVDHDGSTASATSSFDPPLRLIGEEVVDVQIEGGTLDAFAKTLSVPLFLITENELLADDGGTNPTRFVALSRSKGLTLKWQRGAVGLAYAVQSLGSASSSNNPDEPRYSLFCSFPSMEGSGTIDASLLTDLPLDLSIQTFGVVDQIDDWDQTRVRTRLLVDTVTPEKDSAVSLRLVE